VLTIAAVNELGRDEAFAATIYEGVQPGASAALAAFWQNFTGLARDLHCPHANWSEITDCLSWLVSGNGPGDRELWGSVARASEQLAKANPVAASIVSLYALASWEGALGGDLLQERSCQGRWGLDLGWETFPLAAARNLDKAGAIWATRYLAQTAVESIEMSPSWAGQGRDPETTAGYRAVLRHAQRRYGECVDNLAWDLRNSCGAEEPNFRSEVAAMFWSLGDVPHAESLLRTTYVPSREVVAGLVRRSMQVIPFDPGLQEIWLRLKDRPPFALRAHKELFPSINLYWANISLPPFRGRDAGQHRVDALSLSRPTPSRAYAAAATEYFGSGISAETLAQLGETHGLNSEMMATYAPEALVRLRSLLTLVVPEAESRFMPPRSERWAMLAEAAWRTVQAREPEVRDSYDRVLDIPFYYLKQETQPELSAAIELAERYRQAGMWFWRLITPIPLRAPEPAAQSLSAREQEIIAELYARRYFSLIPHLPERSARLEIIEDDRMYRVRPDDVQALVRSAPDRIRELASELNDVVSQIAEADPDFAASRVAARSPIEDFAATIMAGDGSTWS
jgi:hypothetical protein